MMQLSAANSCQKSVAIVGAGAAGLAAVSVLRRSCRVTVFERSSDFVGGVWNFREAVQDGPMYNRLRTNLPKEIMAYPDWEWRQPEASFVAHQQVLQYLKSYCYGQGLEEFIRFGREVVSVRRPVLPAQDTRSGAAGREVDSWIVETRPGGAEVFDAVVLANGHFAKPLVPQLPGVEAVPSHMLSHSCTYRRAEDFQDKVVALLGAGSSGQDIALELASSARHVFLCHRGPPLQSELPSNLTQLGPIEGFEAELEGGDNPRCFIVIRNREGPTRLPVDHVMFCTGYDYDFPFLANELRAVTEPSHVPCLYMHVAHCQLPGLYFLGLCTHVVPFPQVHLQAKLVEAMLLGRLRLPPDAEANCLRDEAEKLAKGVTTRHLHTLGDDQWAYNDQLADLAGCQRLPPVMRLIYDDVKLERKMRLVDYKRWSYRITGLDTFERRLLG